MESGKKEMTRHTIMHAARGVYEKKGIEKTSFSDIAKAADVSRSTVFNHFAGSAELLTALCGQEIDDLEKAYLSSGKQGKDGIIVLFDTLIEDTACYPQLVTQIIQSALMSGDENNPLQMFEHLIGKNLNGDNKNETVILLMGAYYGLINHYHLYNQPFDGKKMKTEMRRLIDAII